jgi:hypothetical protein
MGFAFFIGMIFLFGGLAWYASMQAKKRTEAYQAQATQMGLDFAESSGELVESLRDFALFQRGRSKKARNVLSGDAGDVKISIFDYHFTTGSGKNRKVNQQTVVLLQSTNIQSPMFSMRQQGFFDKFGKALGFQDIDFTSHPKFSQMFVLQGANEQAVRRFFTPSLLEFFETQEKVSVEGGMGRVMIYNARKLLPPDKIKDALAEAYEVYGHIVDQA